MKQSNTFLVITLMGCLMVSSALFAMKKEQGDEQVKSELIHRGQTRIDRIVEHLEQEEKEGSSSNNNNWYRKDSNICCCFWLMNSAAAIVVTYNRIYEYFAEN